MPVRLLGRLRELEDNAVLVYGVEAVEMAEVEEEDEGR